MAGHCDMTIRRIALICGGLDEGRNGVGDYCRRLGAALSKLGLECLLLAMKDPSVDRETVTKDPAAAMTLAQLPARVALRARYARAAALIAEWCPDWTSLQFVPYSFQRKGLPLRDMHWFPPTVRGRKLHVMVHELWAGYGTKRTAKLAVLGAMQRSIILGLLHRMRPRFVDTTNYYYQQLLARSGIEAGVLPLFSNIPVTTQTGEDWIYDAMRQNGGPDLKQDRERWWVLGMFGKIAREWDWPAEPLLARLVEIGSRARRKIIVVSAGHAGSDATSPFGCWRERFPDIRFVAIGPRSPNEISQFLNSVDFGLSPYPLYVLGKSGSAAAMLEHGLPVIASCGDITPHLPVVSAPFESLIWQNDSRLEARLNAPAKRLYRPERCAEVAKMLLLQLERSES
jgi:hypothetical protein